MTYQSEILELDNFFEFTVYFIFEFKVSVIPLTTMQNKTSDGHGRTGANPYSYTFRSHTERQCHIETITYK